MTRRFLIRFPPSEARDSGAQWYTLIRRFSKNSSRGFVAYDSTFSADPPKA
jgi:hypothetical protein